MIARLGLLLALALGGCTQLVAFGQPVVGAPDIVEEEALPGGPLCDPEVAVGETAGCDASCTFDGESECPRVRRSGDAAIVDVSGLREVEVTVSACARAERPLVITGDNGASVAIEQGVLHVRPAREAAASPVRRDDFLPNGECAERSIVLQSGRMELAQGGVRLCSPHLVPVEGEWRIERGAGLRGFELCFRAPR